jgi:hypothetical protein
MHLIPIDKRLRGEPIMDTGVKRHWNGNETRGQGHHNAPMKRSNSQRIQVDPWVLQAVADIAALDILPRFNWRDFSIYWNVFKPLWRGKAKTNG